MALDTLATGAAPWPGRAGGRGRAVIGSPTVTGWRFEGMAAPTSAGVAAMATTTVGASMVATLSDGTQRQLALSYETFFLTGTRVADGAGGTVLAGGYVDIHNQPILDASANAPVQFHSDCPDGMSLITLANPSVSGVAGNTVFAVVQFEYTSLDAAGTSM